MENVRLHKLCVFVFLILSFQPSIHVLSISPPLNQAQEEHAASRLHKQDEGNADEVHCSRERSRAAWKIVEEYLMPFVEREKYQLSQNCRLHPDNDIFRDQELHKKHVEMNEWRCGYCKKSFQSEKYLDQHFDNRHSNLLNVFNRMWDCEGNESRTCVAGPLVSHSKCLADLCGALHCDLVTDVKSRKGKCNPSASARNKHLCEGLADKCFPVNQGPSANRLHELFLRQFCDAHTCSGGHKPFSRGGKKHTSIFYLAISILTSLLVAIFYAVVYLYRRGLRKDSQGFKRISRRGQKPKPS